MKMRMFTGMSTIICLLAFALPAGAFNCNVNAANFGFGSYDVLSGIPRDMTGTITVTCNTPPQHPKEPVPVIISLSPGNSGTFAERQMLHLGGSADRLVYNLYTSTSFSTVWGDGSGGSQTLANFVTRTTPWTATIYGRMPAGQNVSVGTYTDIITVTIEW